MTLARVTVSGIVYRSPEKRFTSNNIPVTDFTINISDKDELLVHAFVRGNMSEAVANEVSKGDMVVVEGRLQLTTIKLENGAERKVMEIDVSSIEKITGAPISQSAPATDNSKLVEFATEEFADELIGDDEIPF